MRKRVGLSHFSTRESELHILLSPPQGDYIGIDERSRASAVLSSRPLKGEGPQKGVFMADLLTVTEVAQILRVDDTTVRRWVRQGALEAIVLPHVNERQAYRIKRETLNKVLDASQEPAAVTK